MGAFFNTLNLGLMWFRVNKLHRPSLKMLEVRPPQPPLLSSSRLASSRPSRSFASPHQLARAVSSVW